MNMAHSVLAIPGQSTQYEDCPEITMVGGGPSSLRITVRYAASEVSADGVVAVGEVAFDDVLELRWIDHEAAYEEYPQHEDDYARGLIELVDSAYIATMASRSGWREHAGLRIRGRPESEVRHFRMGFPQWGTLDVLATRVSIRRAGTWPVPAHDPNVSE